VRLADLQLENYRLSTLAVRFNDEWIAADEPAEREQYDVAPDAEILVSENEPEYLVRLSVTCEPSPDIEGLCRFSLIEATVWGIFSLSDETPEQQRDVLIGYNTISILHGITRGLIISATGGCVGGPFILPAINYKDLFDAKAEDSPEDEQRDAETANEGAGSTVD